MSSISKSSLDSFSKVLSKMATRAIDTTKDAAKKVEVHTKINIRLKSESGGDTLANSVIMTGTKENNSAEYSVLVLAPYAIYVEEGTRHMEGKHFLQEAVLTVKDLWLNYIIKELK